MELRPSTKAENPLGILICSFVVAKINDFGGKMIESA